MRQLSATVHHGEAPRISAQRAITLKGAFDRHPHSFKGRPPQPPRVPDKVYISPPLQHTWAPDPPIETETH